MKVKLKINDFKRAIRQDGNLKMVAKHERLIYVTRQIDTESRLNADQRDKLYDWAHDQYGT